MCDAQIYSRIVSLKLKKADAQIYSRSDEPKRLRIGVNTFIENIIQRPTTWLGEALQERAAATSTRTSI